MANSATRTLLAKHAGREKEASIMAVWAIAWAGSKPVASLADGWLAGTVGLRRTGFILALPALIPVTVLIVLMISVLVVRAWKPRPHLWPAHIPVKFKPVRNWYERAEFYLVSGSDAAMETAPDATQGSRSADAVEPLPAAAG
jgi:hypothetical protein